MQRNREKQQDGKEQRSPQESYTYQGNISCKVGHNQGEKIYGPNRSSYIKKWWQEYKEELKLEEEEEEEEAEEEEEEEEEDLNDPDNCDGVFTHPEPDILECEIKQPLVHNYEQSYQR